MPGGAVGCHGCKRGSYRRKQAAVVLGGAQAAQGSVIVLMVESLSAWHSHLLGSAQDWTPKLDAIARSSHFFKNFYANGFTTSTAEIAILSGNTPLIPPGKPWFDFSDYASGQ